MNVRANNATSLHQVKNLDELNVEGKGKKFAARDSLLQMRTQFNDIAGDLMQHQAELRLIRQEKSPLYQKLEEKIKKTQNDLHAVTTNFSKSAKAVEDLFNRLNPVKLMDPVKGTRLTELRQECTKLWSNIALASYQLNIESVQLNKQINLMPKLDHFLVNLNEQNKIISDYRRNSPAVAMSVGLTTGPYSYILEKEKENFFIFLIRNRNCFEIRHKEALEFEITLKEMLSSFKVITLLEGYPKHLAHKDQDQAAQNNKLFTEMCNKSEEKQKKLYGEYVKLWADICTAHTNLATHITTLEAIKDDKGLMFPWSVTLLENRKLTYVPPAQY